MISKVIITLVTTLTLLDPITIKLYPEGRVQAPTDLLVFVYVARDERNRSVECLLAQDGEPIAGSTIFLQKGDPSLVHTFEFKSLQPGSYQAEVTVLREEPSGEITETSKRSSTLVVTE